MIRPCRLAFFCDWKVGCVLISVDEQNQWSSVHDNGSHRDGHGEASAAHRTNQRYGASRFPAANIARQPQSSGDLSTSKNAQIRSKTRPDGRRTGFFGYISYSLLLLQEPTERFHVLVREYLLDYSSICSPFKISVIFRNATIIFFRI